MPVVLFINKYGYICYKTLEFKKIVLYIYFVKNILKLGGTVAVYDPKSLENAGGWPKEGFDN